jgi:hypothetical protein
MEPPGARSNIAGFGVSTEVTAPVRELVKLHPSKLVVQLFFTLNFAKRPEPCAGAKAGVGLAIVGRAGEQFSVNWGRTSVGEESPPEHAATADSNKDRQACVRIDFRLIDGRQARRLAETRGAGLAIRSPGMNSGRAVVLQ